MTNNIYLVSVVLVGISFGSFVNALVWRVWQQKKIASQKVKRNNIEKEHSITQGRSMCPNCRHLLSALDLIPVISWAMLKGKCRYCHKKISWQYPAVELLTAVLFLISFITWPYNLGNFLDYVRLTTWLSLLTAGMALAVYDLKWMLLPNKLMYSFGGLCLLLASLMAIDGGSATAINQLIGCFSYGGFFWVLYQISNGKWIGGGDVRLGFALGAILGWQKSILGLTLAAYLGTAVVLILVIIKKYHKKMKLPFGPFLLSGAFIAILFGQQVINWYLKLSGL